MTTNLLVTTYNIHGCVGTDRAYDPARIADVIKRIDAPLVGLQEVDTRRPRHMGRDQLAYLEATTGLKAVSGPIISTTEGAYGNALLTRLPVTSIAHHDLSVGRREPRGAVDVTLQAPGGPVRVIVTHLGLSSGERRLQARKLAELVGHLELNHHPTILLGDLNEWRPGGWWLRALRHHFATTLTGRSWHSRVPVFKLDRILVHPRPTWTHTRVQLDSLTQVASDHLPVVATIAWDNKKAD